MMKMCMFFRPFIFLYILVLLLHPGITHAQNDQGAMLKKIVIDPGHGGRDPGAIGAAKTKEKDIVLDIGLRVGKMINEKFPDVEVIYTRKTDVFVELDKRGDIANKAHANLFLSIHANSVKKGSKCPSGTETFVMGNNRLAANMEVAMLENEVILLEDDYSTRYEGFDPNKAESYIIFSNLQNSYLHQSIDFAAEIQDQFEIFAKRVNRKVKQAGLIVLWKTAMPSVLVEVGFICNSEEEKFLNSAAGREKLATAIFQAFCSYKSKIEDRSSYRQGEHPSGIEQPETQNSKPEAQNPNDKTQNEVKPGTQNPKPETQKPKSESSPSKKVEFCVQIATSSKSMDTSPSNFKKYKGVERIQASQSLYKYIVGRTTDYAKVQETLKKARVDFKDAFVVCIVDGKIIPVAEGLKLINN